MSAEFWRLPGPARYIEKIRHDLLDCKNTLTILSPHTPEGLYDELQRGIESRGTGFYWQQLYGKPDHRPPAKWMASHFGVELPTSAGPCEFHDIEQVMGTVVVVTELPADPEILRRWRTFLEHYAQICRSNGGPMSPRLLIQWPPEGDLPESELRLTMHPWSGMLDSVDIALYAAQLVRRKGYSPFNRLLMVALAAKLSGGDPILCRILCNFNMQELLEPCSILAEYARSSGWSGTATASRKEGTLIELDGEIREHPAWMAAQGKEKELGILIWSAQVGVLLPLIEERRQEIVEQVGKYLFVPADLPHYQKVESVNELEIGSIHFQLTNHSNPVPRPIKDVVWRLKELRNHLSHREPVPAALLDEVTIRAITRGL